MQVSWGDRQSLKLFSTYRASGTHAISAVKSRDYYVVQAYVLFSGLVYVVINIVIDLLYLVLNPKIRVGEKVRVKKRNIGFTAACVLLGAILLMSVLAPLLAPYDPNQIDMKNALAGPSAAHWLGTDNIGRDFFSRVMYGGRQSILLALAATSLSMGLGCVIGLIAGYFGGILDLVITSVSNIFQGLPGMTMMIAIAGIMGSGVHSMLLALVLTSWVGFSRLVRGEVMKVKQEAFIE